MNDDTTKGPLIRSPARLVIAIAICLAAGNIGGAVTNAGPGSWYASLAKPDFAPPGAVIGLIWTVLFILMGFSLYLVWMEVESTPLARTAILIFSGQFILNILWSFLFFGLHSPLYGLIDIIVLFFAIAGTIVVFYKIKPAAAGLLVPYIAWVAFASFLNYSIWAMNG